MKGFNVLNLEFLRGFAVTVSTIALAITLSSSAYAVDKSPVKEAEPTVTFASCKQCTKCSKHGSTGKHHHLFHHFHSLFSDTCQPATSHAVKSHCCPPEMPNWTFRFHR